MNLDAKCEFISTHLKGVYSGPITWMTEDNWHVDQTPSPKDQQRLMFVDMLGELGEKVTAYYQNGYHDLATVRGMFLPKPTSDYKFAVILHELGHLLGGKGPRNTTSELEAGYWAVNNAPYWNSEMTAGIWDGTKTYLNHSEGGEAYPNEAIPTELAQQLHSYLISKEQ